MRTRTSDTSGQWEAATEPLGPTAATDDTAR